ncbi:MAG: hypothetical protein BECKG1743E_GA0114224_107544, partial [Candidatus Kentron sp. G]
MDFRDAVLKASRQAVTRLGETVTLSDGTEIPGIFTYPSCYGSRYFGGSVPHTGRGNRGTSRQPDSAH